MRGFTILSAAALIGASFAQAQGVVNVSSDITTSTTWTANNTYNLTTQVFVRPGATLTIQAGTVVASTPSPNGSGSLAVTRGGMIMVQGTATDPVIMTSTNDTATWTADPSHPTGGDPKTGTWREAANEWGNLTIMGQAYISENATVGNVNTPNANNVASMEGLTAAFPGDPDVLYGGGNDNDDSGSIHYLSLRYGGRVLGLANELNGLSLGGIGRATDISHVEIMNNVDDGIEIWGGTVNVSNFSIWNIGDDSFDIDQGWRGKAQFGLIVQGYSLDASQGSGVGDNGFETDGAEDSDWLPVTTASIYNCTFIGQPFDGDGATAWRDNARVQYRNCIFMDCGEKVVRFDNDDGDGANGYGHNGTLTWAQSWTTPWNGSHSGALYQSQVDGNLCEIKDSVFFNNADYGDANAVNVFAAGNNNVFEPSNMPIRSLTRGAPVVKGGKAMVQVTGLDPRPASDALTSVAFAPNDGFFTSGRYRGAFSPDSSWLGNWTASAAFGFTPNETWTQLPGNTLPGAAGVPNLGGSGSLNGGSNFSITVSNAPANALMIVGFGFSRADLPFLGGTVVPDVNSTGFYPLVFADGNGNASLNATVPNNLPASPLYVQAGVFDNSAPQGVAFSHALRGDV